MDNRIMKKYIKNQFNEYDVSTTKQKKIALTLFS